MADGDIRRWPADEPATRKGRRKAKHVTATLDEVKEMRPKIGDLSEDDGIEWAVTGPSHDEGRDFRGFSH